MLNRLSNHIAIFHSCILPVAPGHSIACYVAAHRLAALDDAGVAGDARQERLLDRLKRCAGARLDAGHAEAVCDLLRAGHI